MTFKRPCIGKSVRSHTRKKWASYMRVLPLCIAIGLIVPLCALAEELSAIRGKVVSPAGIPIGQADVFTSRTYTSNPGSPLTIARANTADDGTFELTGIAEGEYQICVTKPTDRLLDPCLWQPDRSPLIVGAGQILEGVELQVAAGYLARVRVADPSETLKSEQSPEQIASIVLAIPLPSALLHSAVLVKQPNSNVHHAEFILPAGDVRPLNVYSVNARVSDEQGADLPPGLARLSIQPPIQGSMRAIHLTLARTTEEPKTP